MEEQQVSSRCFQGYQPGVEDVISRNPGPLFRTVTLPVLHYDIPQETEEP